MNTIAPGEPAPRPSDADHNDDWPPPPTLRTVISRFGTQFLTDSFGPLLGFILINATAGLATAIAVSSAWSLATIGWRKRKGTRSGPLVWGNLAFVAVRGVVGILTRSNLAFFGPGVISDLLIAAFFAGSVLLRRPAVGSIAPAFYAFPDQLRQHTAYRRIFARITLAWAMLLAGTGLVEYVLLTHTTTNVFLLLRAILTWPLFAGLFIWSLRYPRRAFAQEPDIGDRLELALLRNQLPAT